MVSEGNILSQESKLEANICYTELNIEEIEIKLDFSEMFLVLFPELYTPKSREDAKNKIFKLIQEHPKIKTTEILDKIDYDEWKLLEILDKKRIKNLQPKFRENQNVSDIFWLGIQLFEMEIGDRSEVTPLQLIREKYSSINSDKIE